MLLTERKSSLAGPLGRATALEGAQRSLARSSASVAAVQGPARPPHCFLVSRAVSAAVGAAEGGKQRRLRVRVQLARARARERGGATSWLALRPRDSRAIAQTRSLGAYVPEEGQGGCESPLCSTSANQSRVGALTSSSSHHRLAPAGSPPPQHGNTRFRLGGADRHRDARGRVEPPPAAHPTFAAGPGRQRQRVASEPTFQQHQHLRDLSQRARSLVHPLPGPHDLVDELINPRDFPPSPLLLHASSRRTDFPHALQQLETLSPQQRELGERDDGRRGGAWGRRRLGSRREDAQAGDEAAQRAERRGRRRPVVASRRARARSRAGLERDARPPPRRPRRT